MKGIKTSRIWKYMNNADLFPNWKTITENGNNTKNTNHLVNPHLYECKKSAVILDKNLALVVFANFTKMDKPVFYGKDIIHETFEGYHFFGHFPKEVLPKFSYLY